ncbi:MAG TPA: hypothetical protein VII43_04070 [Opitutaceae bacterium]
MTTRHLIALAASAWGLAALSGCAGPGGAQAPQDTTKFTVGNTERFAALDAATQEDISCTGLQERTLGDGRLEIVASLRNRGDKPMRLQVQCLFLDARGLPIGDAGQWELLQVGAGSTEVERFTAAVAGEGRYAIRVRSAR